MLNPANLSIINNSLTCHLTKEELMLETSRLHSHTMEATDHYTYVEQAQMTEKPSDVFRTGYVLETPVCMPRAEALKFSELLEEEANKNLAGLKVFLEKLNGVKSVELEEGNVIRFTNDKALLRFPDALIELKSSDKIVLGLSCTVCEEELHSKVWVRLHVPQGALEEHESMSKDIITWLKSFYESVFSQYHEITNTNFEVIHEFEISARDTDDPDFIDVFNSIAFGRGISDPLKFGKRYALNELISYALGVDAASLNESQLQRTWSKWTKARHRVVMPAVVGRNKSLFFIDVDSDRERTVCTGLSAFDDMYGLPEDLTPRSSSSYAATAKIADRLAADL